MFKQSLLPGFPEGAQRIGASLNRLERDGQGTYFVGGDNYFSHPQDDLKSRRFVLASLMDNGHVRAVDLEGSPLLIPKRTLMNWTAQYRKHGSVSFFRNACQAAGHEHGDERAMRQSFGPGAPPLRGGQASGHQ